MQDVVIWHKLRMTADEIVYHYPTITMADVYGALAYYWDNKDEIDRKIADDEAYYEEQKRKYRLCLKRSYCVCAWLSPLPVRRAHTSRCG